MTTIEKLSDQAKMLELGNLIAKYDYEYYINDNSIISDSQYDTLRRELVSLESKYPEHRDPNSPTSRVGHGKSTKAPVKHLQPMLSLSNALTIEELEVFTTSLPPDTMVAIEPKFDGLSLEGIYHDGVLVTASTRGDGEIGEDVTANARTITNLPLKLKGDSYPPVLGVYGEVVMLKKTLEELNQETLDTGKGKLLANTRNAASGALRNSDPSITASRKLKFIAHGISTPLDTIDGLHTMESFGFTVDNKIALIFNSGVSNYIRNYYWRDKLPYDIDGLVIKVNDLSLKTKLGVGTTAPKWAIAYKFPPAEGNTKVLGIDIQVGRMGALTPVARLEPIKLGGVVISNATLHNYEEIERLDVRVGDTVTVCRSGDVIPKVLGVVIAERSKRLPKVKIPTECPVCGGELCYASAVIYCTNSSGCKPQIVGALEHFVSKKAVDVDGLGEVAVQALIDANLVNKPADYFKLTVEQLTPIFGKKTAVKLINGIAEKAAGVQPYRVLYGLGIREVGEGTAKTICKYRKLTPDAELNMSLEDLPDIGEVTAGSITNYFSDPINLANFTELLSLITLIDTTPKVEQDLLGQTWVITGSFPNRTREDVKADLEARGAKVAGKVTKRTTGLLVGGELTGTKYNDAMTLGIQIYDKI